MTQPNLQMRAAQVVLEVVDRGRSLDEALAAQPAPASPRERAQLREIAAGGCRHYHYFDALLAGLLRKPFDRAGRVAHFLLINACHQIECMRTPDHAAVSEAVSAVAGGRHAWAAGIINAVLRNFLRRRAQLKRDLESAAGAADSGDGDGAGDGGGDGAGDCGRDDTAAAAWFAVPVWLYRAIRAHWPAYFRAILDAGNRKPPLTLRVNRRRISRDAYLAQLAAAGIDAQPTADSALGVTLTAPLPVARIPGFADGLATVQDESAQLALAALDSALQSPGGGRVLDACAAPGGKTGLLLEAGANVVAVDLPARGAALRDNLTRLGFADGESSRDDGDDDGDGDAETAGAAEATVIAGDLTNPGAWWDRRRFDCILLDVPCSGSGVIRRHPDIKHRRRPSDIDKFAAQQRQLLAAAWRLLAEGGALLYVTCSILPAENDAVVEQFTAQQNDAAVQTLNAPTGIATTFGVQRLPGVHPGDGFYFCRLNKIAPGITTKTATKTAAETTPNSAAAA